MKFRGISSTIIEDRLSTANGPPCRSFSALTARRFPDRACFTVYEPEKRSLSYRESLEKIEGAARKLRALGIGRGDKVAVAGKNSPEWAVAYFSVLTAGAVVVPLDYQLAVPELANLVHAGDVVALFIDEEKEAELKAACPGLKAAFSLAAGRPDYVLDLDAPGAPAFESPAEGDLAAILFTSGTMGTPKGVMLSHRNFVSDCLSRSGQPPHLPYRRLLRPSPDTSCLYDARRLHRGSVHRRRDRLRASAW